MSFDYSKEFKMIAEAYKKAGGNEKTLINNKFGSIVINENRVLGKNEINGFHVKHESIKEGVNVKIFIDAKVKIEFPIHLCFGMLPKEGKQVINSEFFIGKDAKVKFLAHCIFPNAKHIEHIMNSKVSIGENAEMSYIEEHYHSESGGTFVYPKLRGEIKKGGKLFEEFRLTRGRVGVLNIDYEIEQNEWSVCDILTKVYGKKDDRIEVRESLHLNGVYAAGTAKSRIVLIDNAFGNVLGEIEGNAAYTRGHVDCHEVVHGKGAKAISTPKISVENSLARVTHEAAIGRINKKELETLMARGLTEEEAVDVIVKGLLR
ncbi:MAG: SufD family Fe-S cluster assembly protein [Candidatus Cloacimonetes bacterium]|nr:SufD family Fe-S cluster assembly protein [Candidatus Cloacimonadota bacterium]